MQLSVAQRDLKRGLSIVGRAVVKRSTFPITQSVLLTAEDSCLRLSATDLTTAITHTVPAQVEVEGSLAIPARQFSALVRGLPEGRIDLTVEGGAVEGENDGKNKDVQVLRIAYARREARIWGQSADDFPSIPTVGEGEPIYVDSDALKKALGRVVFAAATDETRPVLTGVLTEFDNDHLTLAAADGFRLSVHTVPLRTPMAEKVSVIIPARAYFELNRLLGDQTDPVAITISPSGTQVLFRLKAADVVSQIIQGTFPNYQQLIPKSYTTRCELEVTEFLQAARVAVVFPGDRRGVVRLSMIGTGESESGRIVLSMRDEQGGEGMWGIDAEVEGEAGKVAFNGRYLTDVLSALGNGKVSLETTSPSSPGVFRPAGSDDFTHVLMPI